MDNRDLLILLLIMPIVDWIATGMLVALALRRPRIGVLSERAFAAIGLSIVTTVYGLVALNTELGFPILDPNGAKVIVRLGIIFLGAGPLAWLFLYWRHR